jgi:hypothetical protein
MRPFPASLRVAATTMPKAPKISRAPLDVDDFKVPTYIGRHNVDEKVRVGEMGDPANHEPEKYER